MSSGNISNKLNILIYNNDLPLFPGSGAHEFLNTTQLAKWVKKLGLISMVHTLEDNAQSKLFAEHSVNLYLWKNPHIAHQNPSPSKRIHWQKKIHNFLALIKKYSLKIFTYYPDDVFASNHLFYHLSTPLNEALTETKWHAFIVIQSSSAKIINYLPRAPLSVLVMHDIRALVCQRQAEIEKNLWKKIYYHFQARRYFQFEKKYARQFDLIIALSTHDANWIKNNYSPKQIAIIPIPVDLNYFRPHFPLHERSHRIVFTGNMAHPPNVDAAIFYATKIFPFVRKQIPQAEFYIVGKSPTPAVLRLADLPGVIVTGSVPDTRSFLAEATVVVVPLRFGSGVRNKILEAWGMQKCIISTTLGAEGLEYENGVHLKIADDANEMISATLQALRDPTYRQQLSLDGREIAKKNHDPEKIGKTYFDVIQTQVQKKIESTT